MLGARNSSVLALLATWMRGSVLAVHNFSSEPARATIQLPKETEGGRWHHLFGPNDSDEPGPESGRLTLELPAYGYHWFGTRQGD